MNVCRLCGLDFAGIRDFEAHRVGTHAYTFGEGLRMDPPREDGRRCLDVSEMYADGWAQNRYGRWRRKQRRVPIALRGVRGEATR